MRHDDLDLLISGSSSSNSTKGPLSGAVELAWQANYASQLHYLPAQVAFALFLTWSVLQTMDGNVFYTPGQIFFSMTLAPCTLAYIFPMLLFNSNVLSFITIPSLIYIDPTLHSYGYVVITLGKFYAYIASNTIWPIIMGFAERVLGI